MTTVISDIALVVITDGRRDCISRTIPSAMEHLNGPITSRLIYDDSGDDAHRDWLERQFGPLGFDVFSHPGGRQGFGGAISAAWARAADLAESFVFHLEDDFTFNRPIDLHLMTDVLHLRSSLVQLALRRQPWNELERAAGGIVEMHPEDYEEHRLDDRHVWLEHRRHFTTNPCLYRRSLCELAWPVGRHSEGHFGIGLLNRHPTYRFGYWGARDSGEWVTHIGTERVGTGY